MHSYRSYLAGRWLSLTFVDNDLFSDDQGWNTGVVRTGKIESFPVQ